MFAQFQKWFVYQPFNRSVYKTLHCHSVVDTFGGLSLSFFHIHRWFGSFILSTPTFDCLSRSFESFVSFVSFFFAHSFLSFALSCVHSSNCWLNIKLNEFIKFTGLSFSIFLIFYKEILNKTFRLRLFVLRQPFYAVMRANTNIKCESFHRITSMKT